MTVLCLYISGDKLKLLTALVHQILTFMILFVCISGDKLKLLTALVHQILTFSASRDLLEDNLDQFKQVSYDLRHHRWAETRRDKEEAGFLYVITRSLIYP